VRPGGSDELLLQLLDVLLPGAELGAVGGGLAAVGLLSLVPLLLLLRKGVPEPLVLLLDPPVRVEEV